jgi:Putative lumazine-binding
MKHIRLLLLASLLFAAGILSCSKHESSPKDGDPAVRAFLENYFRTWSNQDMDGYASCFQDSARITFVTDAKGTLHTETLSDFLHGQRMGHKTATEPMRETADSMIVHSDDRAAIARVPWTLIKGNQRSTGIDHFSLIKTPAGWKIVHLLFYSN